ACNWQIAKQRTAIAASSFREQFRSVTSERRTVIKRIYTRNGVKVENTPRGLEISDRTDGKMLAAIPHEKSARWPLIVWPLFFFALIVGAYVLGIADGERRGRNEADASWMAFCERAHYVDRDIDGRVHWYEVVKPLDPGPPLSIAPFKKSYR